MRFYILLIACLSWKPVIGAEGDLPRPKYTISITPAFVSDWMTIQKFPSLNAQMHTSNEKAFLNVFRISLLGAGYYPGDFCAITGTTWHRALLSFDAGKDIIQLGKSNQLTIGISGSLRVHKGSKAIGCFKHRDGWTEEIMSPLLRPEHGLSWFANYDIGLSKKMFLSLQAGQGFYFIGPSISTIGIGMGWYGNEWKKKE